MEHGDDACEDTPFVAIGLDVLCPKPHESLNKASDNSHICRNAERIQAYILVQKAGGMQLPARQPPNKLHIHPNAHQILPKRPPNDRPFATLLILYKLQYATHQAVCSGEALGDRKPPGAAPLLLAPRPRPRRRLHARLPRPLPRLPLS